MRRLLKLPTQACAIGLFAITGLMMSNPIAALVDCTDSFWLIACAADTDAEPRESPADEGPGLIRIDNEPTCSTIEGGFIVCHT